MRLWIPRAERTQPIPRPSSQGCRKAIFQRLLALGAKLYDGLNRLRFVSAVEANEEREVTALEMEEEGTYMPSSMEYWWIC